MGASRRVAVVLGAGANIGHKVTGRFTAAGYKVAVISRSGDSVPSVIATMSLSADFTDSRTIHEVFEEIRGKLGEQSVLIYNGRRWTLIP